MIRTEIQDDIASLTIDRPEKANSLTGEMLAALRDEVITHRDTAKAIVIKGTGKVFSAGADLDEARAGLALSPVWEELSSAIAGAPCLTIAALNGTVAGGAFGMVLASDIRIAVPQAKFFYPVMKLGFLPQPSDPVRMSKLIGPSRAKMILMAGQKVDAETALAWGLIDQVVLAEDMDVIVTQLTDSVRVATPAHVAAIKAMV